MDESDPHSSLPQKTVSNWDSLGQDLTELILACLPIPSVIQASAVCKLWNSVINSYSFKTRVSDSRRPPWLFLCGQNKSFLNRNQAFAFDPESDSWIKLPIIALLSKNLSAASNGFFFSTCPGKFSFKPVFNGMWRQQARRCTRLWQMYKAVWLWRFTILTVIPGNSVPSARNFQAWKLVQAVMLISVQRKTLRSKYLFSINGDLELNLWRIDEKTLEFSEIGIMPPDLLSMLIDSNENLKFTSLKCMGSRNFIYVFKEERPWDCPVCVCEMSKSGKCSWRRVPSLPEPRHEFEKVISFCSNVSFLDILGNGSD
ncbi:UNVERIFIED_CONTAM: F-box/kelch-repeat protein [Sesamum calycinum]|uniref:F-box/kelch-repeat protein n=1 Tax=Sesamum calycinum TaxID=2727403 RepID=A0AAW2RTS9_9LAMI